MAKLIFNYGAMNSGKTTALMSTAHNYGEINTFGRKNGETLVLKPDVDSKGGRQLVNRRGEVLDVDILADPQMDVRREVQEQMGRAGIVNLACLLVDEAQFSTRDQVWQMLQLARLDNIPVMAYGIRTDFKGESFPGA